jgi:hypothetical protein
MTSSTIISSCWSVLTEIYGFSDYEARILILKHPKLISKNLLKSGSQRLEFFRIELGIVPPFYESQKLILKYPQILYVDLHYFLEPNIKILKKYLNFSFEEMSSTVC